MAKSVLPDVWEVPQVFRERLGEQAGRQRTMFADGHLLLILHEPPKPGEDVRHGRFFWRQADGTWSSSGNLSGTNALNQHIKDYADAVQQFDDLEQKAQTAEEYFNVIEGLAPLHRAARNLHAVLQEARKLVPHDRDIIDFRDQAYQVERTAELLYDVAKNSLAFAVAKRAEEEAQASREMAVSAHRLNLLAAFFFPIVTLAAIFSTNLHSGLDEVGQPFGWVLIMIIGLVCGGILMRFVTQQANRK